MVPGSEIELHHHIKYSTFQLRKSKLGILADLDSGSHPRSVDVLRPGTVPVAVITSAPYLLSGRISRNPKSRFSLSIKTASTDPSTSVTRNPRILRHHTIEWTRFPLPRGAAERFPQLHPPQTAKRILPHLSVPWIFSSRRSRGVKDSEKPAEYPLSRTSKLERSSLYNKTETRNTSGHEVGLASLSTAQIQSHAQSIAQVSTSRDRSSSDNILQDDDAFILESVEEMKHGSFEKDVQPVKTLAESVKG